MKKSKIKSESHLIESKSLGIITKYLPDYWTIREYKPDYGLDLSIEIFDKVTNGTKPDYETLGEHLFIQVKGTKSIKKEVKKFPIGKHVEKNIPYSNDSSQFFEKEVIKFQLETSELYTIERMSPSLPVMLFLVDVTEEKIYFLCLNDYIDKVILSCDPKYTDKGSKVIYIPVDNVIDSRGIEIMKFYSKRPKLYSFFIKVNYQKKELGYVTDENLKSIYPYYIDKLLNYDIWSLSDFWYLLAHHHKKIIMLKETGNLLESEYDLDSNYSDEKCYESSYSNDLFTLKEIMLNASIRTLWENLASISDVYEEDCREYFLPTYFYQTISMGK